MVQLGSQPKSTNNQGEFDNQRDEVYGSLRSTVAISRSYVRVPEGNRSCKPAKKMTHNTAIYIYNIATVVVWIGRNSRFFFETLSSSRFFPFTQWWKNLFFCSLQEI